MIHANIQVTWISSILYLYVKLSLKQRFVLKINVPELGFSLKYMLYICQFREIYCVFICNTFVYNIHNIQTYAKNNMAKIARSGAVAVYTYLVKQL